jgi:hypothetical protein
VLFSLIASPLHYQTPGRASKIASAKTIVVLWILKLFLLPVDVLAEFRLEPLDVKAKHPVDTELPELTRITVAKRGFFFARKLVIRHDTFEIRQGMLVYGLFHFEIE